MPLFRFLLNLSIISIFFVSFLVASTTNAGFCPLNATEISSETEYYVFEEDPAFYDFEIGSNPLRGIGWRFDQEGSINVANGVVKFIPGKGDTPEAACNNVSYEILDLAGGYTNPLPDCPLPGMSVTGTGTRPDGVMVSGCHMQAQRTEQCLIPMPGVLHEKSNHFYHHPIDIRIITECQCNTGYAENEFGFCDLIQTEEDPDDGDCDSGAKGPSANVGNPIHAATGNKFQKETDFKLDALGLYFSRSYNSRSRYMGALGFKWTHNYERFITWSESEARIKLSRGDGKSFKYLKSQHGWQSVTDKLGQLSERYDGDTLLGWQYITAASDIETYNLAGQLSQVTDLAGLQTRFIYNLPEAQGGDDNDKTLDTITEAFGRSMTFAYNEKGFISRITTPDQQSYHYSYDNLNNLTAVRYPDESDTDNIPNPERYYYYDNPNFPHALTAITHENGEVYARYTYDEQGRAISSDHGNGIDRTELIYNDNGTTQVTSSNGGVQLFQFEKISGAQKVTGITGDPCASCGSSQAVTYDDNGFVSTKTDHNGHISQYSYSDTGLELSRTEAFGSDQQRTITTTWHPQWRLPSSISQPGKRTDFSYNSQGQLIERIITDTSTGETRETRYSYGQNTRLASISLGPIEQARTTYYRYDNQGNLASTTNPLRHTTLFTDYDNAGRLLRTVDANGTETLLNYDARGRLLSSTVDGAQTQFTLDAVGNITQVSLPDNTTINYQYDQAHRLFRISDIEGNTIQFSLDNAGNRTRQRTFDKNGELVRIQQAVYDTLNRLVQSINAEGDINQYSYDLNDNLTRIVDPLNNTTSNSFDALNRLISRTDALSKQTTYTYNSLDQLTTVTDPNGLQTHYQYNAFGDMTEINSPDTGTTTYTYNAYGETTQKTDARDTTVNYSHDLLGRLLTANYPDAQENLNYTYDNCQNGIGRLCQLQDPSGTTTYQYDPRGNLVTETKTNTVDGQPVTYTTQYQYTPVDTRQQITYPSGRTVQYSHDNQGRIHRISTHHNDQSTILVDNITYQAFGPINSQTYGNGLQENRSFDLNYRLTNQQETSGLYNTHYQYDANNRISQIDKHNTTQHYQYDSLNRLIDDQGDYGNRTYQYDSNGNRIHRSKLDIINQPSINNTSPIPDAEPNSTPPGETDLPAGPLPPTEPPLQSTKQRYHDYHYPDNSHHLQSIDRKNTQDSTRVNTQHRNYDANGNTLQINNRQYLYNQANRLSQFSKNDQAIADYLYNGHGQRTVKIKHKADDGMRNIHYHYDQQGRLLGLTRYNKNNIRKTDKDIIWFNDQPIAQITTRYKNNGDIKRIETHYIHSDHLNTPRFATDADQNIVWQWQSDAFGQGAPHTDPDQDGKKIHIPLRFPGQIASEGGLYYNYFRDYEPATGRYVQSDPIGLQGGLNTFGYVEGNPLSYVDPYGLSVWGVSVGGEFGFRGRVFGGSITFALDHNGSFAILGSAEGGAGSRGFEGFARGLFGFGNNTVDSLAGPGISISGNAGRFSGSASLPYKYTSEKCQEYPYGDHGANPPVLEFGFGVGKSGASVTGSYSRELHRNESLGDLGRAIGSNLFDLLN